MAPETYPAKFYSKVIYLGTINSSKDWEMLRKLSWVKELESYNFEYPAKLKYAPLTVANYHSQLN